ncbi:MAG: beta-lactamase family protein [Anaerolineales bacterium]|nr:beta-lactamase family protein [Anaerolineales bacterium]
MPQKIRDANFQKLTATIKKEMKRLQAPGVALAIWHKGQEHSIGLGVTSVESPLPVTPDTLFQIGSISKTFTGTILMQLAEQGKVQLDAPVKKYIKDFKLKDKTVEKQVTIRHLLTHLGGWVGDYFNDFGNGDDALEKMVRDIAKLPQVQPLGKIWSYNNTGFNIASRVIEVVTKKTYEQIVQEALFTPLKMNLSFFYPSDILFTHRFVVGHYLERGKIEVARPWAIGRAGNGVGGVVSSVRDLLKYARFHMGNGNGILTKKSLQAMREPQASAGGRGQIGVTWFIQNVGALTRYSHGGATHGQQALFMFIPEEDFAFAILTNSDNGGVINNQIAAQALKLYFGAENKTPQIFKKANNELREFAGSYRIGTEAFDLKAKDGMLIYHHIPLGGFPTPDTPPGPALAPMRFAFFAQDLALGLDEPLKGAIGDFIRNSKGKIEYFRVGARAHKKIK